jgi:E3 Ubiquitin ligase
VTFCLSLFIPIDYPMILPSLAIAGGLYFLFVGFQLLARKRLLLATLTVRIRNAALGPIEVNGAASGPHTMPAPITGKPCFLYHTIAWQQRDGKKQEWEKVVDETLHLPFFVDDSTGQLLVEPLGADLDLEEGFREEYDASFFSSTSFANEAAVPPRVSVFLSRHNIVPGRRLRIEEWTIKPDDTLFITGTLTENPGVQVRPFSPRGDSAPHHEPRNPTSSNSAEERAVPQIVRLSSGSAPSNTQEMSQQAKIAAALNRAGITKPEAWSAAGISYQPVAVAENAPSMPVSRDEEAGPREEPPASSDFNLAPPVVLMKGEKESTFVISFRSQKEFVSALAWKSAGMLCGGTAITLLGIYRLLAQMELR